MGSMSDEEEDREDVPEVSSLAEEPRRPGEPRRRNSDIISQLNE
jgi:hypothetical protein